MAVSPEDDEGILPGPLAQPLLAEAPVTPPDDVAVDDPDLGGALSSGVTPPADGGVSSRSSVSALDAFAALASGSSREAARSGFGEMDGAGAQAIIALLESFGVKPSFGETEATGTTDETDVFAFPPAPSETMDDSPLDPFRDAIDPTWLGLLVEDPGFAALAADDVAALVQLDADLQIVGADAPDGWAV
jgi:hypothetical protein